MVGRMSAWGFFFLIHVFLPRFIHSLVQDGIEVFVLLLHSSSSFSSLVGVVVILF